MLLCKSSLSNSVVKVFQEAFRIIRDYLVVVYERNEELFRKELVQQNMPVSFIIVNENQR